MLEFKQIWKKLKEKEPLYAKYEKEFEEEEKKAFEEKYEEAMQK